jgi:hypothetical protein
MTVQFSIFNLVIFIQLLMFQFLNKLQQQEFESLDLKNCIKIKNYELKIGALPW